jgi:2-amino-4-hydroxy-6-hydroxymethyldihydropteridine diphosphokinase
MSNQFNILLGSNQDAYKNMETAKDLLIEAFPEIRFSNFMESEAIVREQDEIQGCAPEKYLNAVAIGRTAMELDEIQVFLKQAETALGRIRGSQSKAFVAIDLDLVEWNKKVLRPKDAAQSYYINCLLEMQKQSIL